MSEKIGNEGEGRREALITQFKMGIMFADLGKVNIITPQGEETYFSGSISIPPDLGMRFFHPAPGPDADKPSWDDEATVQFVQYNKYPARRAGFKIRETRGIERTLYEDAGEFAEYDYSVTRELTVIEMERLVACIRMPMLMVENIREFVTPTPEEALALSSQRTRQPL